MVEVKPTKENVPIMPKRIVIAEDDQMSNEMLASFARDLGYEVVSVYDGLELLEVLAEKQFDLIITDLMMGSIDGAVATEILKMQDNTIPVIALTALSPEEITLTYDKFIKVFHKPCNFAQLFEYVASIIG